MAGDRVGAAVVTGAASGFGRAIAEHLAAQGAGVAMLDIDGDRVSAAAGEVTAAHDVATIGRRVDVSSSDDLAAAAAEVTERFGAVDLLWANVGVQHFGAVEATDERVWQWMLDVNVVGSVRTVQAFLPSLRRSAHAHLAFTASANALAPAARLGAYQATKYAVVGIAETLRFELADEPIDVSVVYPAGMLTRHLESSAAARPSELGGGDVDEDDLAAMMASRPMTDADLTTPEIAAANALAGVLAGEPHVITHGVLDAAVAEQQGYMRDAVAKVRQRQPL
jgi:NAD(P)-dependent dehydrogenase (short-subunit alcohol dehydrogenase family)